MKRNLILSIILILSQIEMSESEHFSSIHVSDVDVESSKDSRKDELLVQVAEVIRNREQFSRSPIKQGEHHYVGYGHLTLDSLSTITKKDADSLLFDDLHSNIKMLKHHFSSESRMIHLAGVLSYNIGVGNVLKSRFWSLIKRNSEVSKIKKEFLEFRLFDEAFHENMYNRRLEEFKIYE